MAALYPPPVASSSVPSSRVELHISCAKLKDTDVFSKSDPIVCVHTQVGKTWTEVSREAWDREGVVFMATHLDQRAGGGTADVRLVLGRLIA